MIDRDHYDIAPLGKVSAVVGLQFAARTDGESATVEPEHDWSLAVVVQPWGPDVQAQAVFVHLPVVVLKQKCHVIGRPEGSRVWAVGSVLHEVTHARPGLRLL